MSVEGDCQLKGSNTCYSHGGAYPHPRAAAVAIPSFSPLSSSPPDSNGQRISFHFFYPPLCRESTSPRRSVVQLLATFARELGTEPNHGCSHCWLGCSPITDYGEVCCRRQETQVVSKIVPSPGFAHSRSQRRPFHIHRYMCYINASPYRIYHFILWMRHSLAFFAFVFRFYRCLIFGFRLFLPLLSCGSACRTRPRRSLRSPWNLEKCIEC